MSSAPSVSLVLSFEEARRVVEQLAAAVTAPQTEAVDLLAAADRVLAEQITADRNLPPFPRSTRDGYAVRSADLSQLPATLDVIAEIKAGEKLESIPSIISGGQAAAIMTGAPVPSGADAVVMVEYTSERDQRVEITRAVAPGENLVPEGAEARGRLGRRHRIGGLGRQVTAAGL